MARASPLKRRLAPPRPVRGAGDRAVEKLLRVEVPRAADQLLALQADVQAVTVTGLDHAGVVRALCANDLICLMTRDANDVGLLVEDPGLLTALIEVQTLGKVTSSPPTERRPTPTDAVVVSDIVDKWMTDVVRAADDVGLSEDVPFYGFSRAHGILDLRAVELTLDPGMYTSMRISMALGGDTKTGALTFFTPALSKAMDAGGEGSLGARLRPAVLAAPAEMNAILARVEQPLSKVLAFKEGDVVPVDAGALTRILLEVSEDVPVARARLGQVNGFRAVRLTTAVEGDADAPFIGAAGGAADKSEILPVDTTAALELNAPDPVKETVLPEITGDLPDLPELAGLPEMETLPDLPDIQDLPES